MQHMATAYRVVCTTWPPFHYEELENRAPDKVIKTLSLEMFNPS